VHDPARGSVHAPAWPDVPVAGSPLDHVLGHLAAVRTSLALDDEGKDGDKPMKSLHAVGELEVK
jgi:hypothetical protein